MTILWLVILILLVMINKAIVKKMMQHNKMFFARVSTTLTSLCAFILVYLFIKALIPPLIMIMNVFYHH
ncbi:hypothetical protein CD145_08885 [Staphylococcus saccharolyticus]|uniref:Membrane protein n=1 Tax=Staphylococcus saccharolyticus TaxID=33028 RepID=A0A380H871_9STAP|nr:hypothetical protein CD145_08885 [Staphylococcus saccharolyticus]TAA96953.1 hypothetical protein DMB72_09105 [Staphylococcus saccharolyticus]TAA97300.1 hypothetical protein DMB73_09095 [Staphylococcus saccharolyticus]TAB01650.1 hypothetical protein DMB78_09105 [Staphylococcus saccharolyticus]SUM73652.1 membrane protein [Staphylococcus saccharolyticus]